MLGIGTAKKAVGDDSSMVTIVTKNNVLRMSCNKLRKRLVLGRSQGS